MILAILLSAAAAASPAQKSPSERAALQHITAAEISGHLRFLGDDLLEGRKPGTQGSELAVKYLASQLEAFGLQPAGANGTFIQPVPIVELRGKLPPSVVFKKAGGQEVSLQVGGGVKADVILDPDAEVDVARLQSAPLVFVGYGIVAPEYGWDDYKDVDVKGKVVVIMNFNPPFKGEGNRLWYGRWPYKFETAAAHGAAGALIIHTTPSAGYPWQVLANSADGVRLNLPPEPGEPRMQFEGWITDDGAKKLLPNLDELRASAQQKIFKPVPLDATLSLEMPVAKRTVQSANVVGLLPGTDAKLKSEAVVFTAHHDHLGKVAPVPPATDGIYNGALDNASGCAAILTEAHAATFAPPKRSMYFVFVTAEESGLLGSRYFAQHPPIPAGRIAADINSDSFNKWGKTSDLSELGLGKSTADDVIRQVAKEQGRTVHGDSHPDRGSFYRSDQFELARVGVPPVAVKGGPTFTGKPAGWGDQQMLAFEQHDYHQPSDEYHGDWDLSGAVQDAQLQLVVGLRIANAPKMPTWVPGDEFEAARKKAAR
jgi:Zn-dependent M28 family amino/carboxypeptidase